jgi:hypothetical protein
MHLEVDAKRVDTDSHFELGQTRARVKLGCVDCIDWNVGDLIAGRKAFCQIMSFN